VGKYPWILFFTIFIFGCAKKEPTWTLDYEVDDLSGKKTPILVYDEELNDKKFPKASLNIKLTCSKERISPENFIKPYSSIPLSIEKEVSVFESSGLTVDRRSKSMSVRVLTANNDVDNEIFFQSNKFGNIFFSTKTLYIDVKNQVASLKKEILDIPVKEEFEFRNGYKSIVSYDAQLGTFISKCLSTK